MEARQFSNNAAALSVGMDTGKGLPFGWTVGAGWNREDAERLDSDFEGKYVRGDVVVPVSPHLAVTGGIGYEGMTGSQQDILRDAGGVPIVTPGGDLIADPNAPRLLAYDQSGLITGSAHSPAGDASDEELIVETVEMDHGWCHTIGYVSPLVAAAAIGAHLSGAPVDGATLRELLASGARDEAGAEAIAGRLATGRTILTTPTRPANSKTATRPTTAPTESNGSE